MVAAIDISPPAAAQAGCSATATVVDSWSYGGDWYRAYSFEATAAAGWVFDHWEQTYDYQEGEAGGTVLIGAKCSSVDRTWRSGSYSQEGTEEWRSDYTSVGPEYVRVDLRTIVGLVAIFRRASTGLILRSAANGQILRGAGGTILRDA